MNKFTEMQLIAQAQEVLSKRRKNTQGLSKTYPHTKYILDWLSGVGVQYWEDGLWKDMPSPEIADKVPHFYRDGQYRYKPVSVRFRVGVLPTGYMHFVFSLKEEKEAEGLGVRWTTYWHEYTGDPSC